MVVCGESVFVMWNGALVMERRERLSRAYIYEYAHSFRQTYLLEV